MKGTMKALVIGLGSMGKRRVRNLIANGVTEISGFDKRDDRVKEAEDRYGVKPAADLASALDSKPDVVIISLPPDLHAEACLESARRSLPFFVEAGVLLEGTEAVAREVERRSVVAMASCTMRYFPGPRAIKRVVSEGTIGKPLFWQYQSGQYLPDWHPWEHIRDFYVSQRETGGCREIVPFELTWLLDVFGDVAEIRGLHAKLSDIDADIDDYYSADLLHRSGTRGQLIVDVISRPPARNFRLTGSEGALEWDGIANTARIGNAESKWSALELPSGNAESGYINPEEPYIEEIGDFLAAARGERAVPNTIRDDIGVLEALVAIEKSATTPSLQTL